MCLEFKIEIDEGNFKEDVLKILKEIRSDWDKTEVNFKVNSLQAAYLGYINNSPLMNPQDQDQNIMNK